MKRNQRWFRRWLATAIIGDSLVLLSMCKWFPEAGFDLFNAPHVRLVVASGGVVGLAFVLSTIGLYLRRHQELIGCAVVSLQLLAMIPSLCAISPWPGGDDGPRMGWGVVVIPLMVILAVAGLVGCVLGIIARRRVAQI